MVNNTDCDALRLSRKLGTSSRRDDCARRTCDTETKMRSTAEISSPRKFLLVHSAAVGERTKKSESREDERQSAYQSSARNVCRLGVLSAHGVFANVRTLRNFFLLLKG